MRIITTILFLIIALPSIAQNISKARYNDLLVKSIKDKDVNYITGAFSPNLYLQHVIIFNTYNETDYNNFKKGKGKLYKIFFDSNYVNNTISNKAYSFYESITKSKHLTINRNINDRLMLSSITAAYKDYFYDIILNCNENTCEIIGLNISSCKNIGSFLLSSMPSKNLQYKRLRTHPNLSGSRKWHSKGIQKLDIYNKMKDKIYGPNKRFQVLYAGIEDGVGGAVYIKLSNNNFLLFKHLTAINSILNKTAGTNKYLAPGTFIGGCNEVIGINYEGEPAKLTIEGRSISGSILTRERIVQLLKGMD